jgi:hypothetical protein
LEGSYLEKDGEFVLDVEGVVEKARLEEVRAKVDEFRSNNLALKKQLEEANERFEGIDPVKARRAGLRTTD